MNEFKRVVLSISFFFLPLTAQASSNVLSQENAQELYENLNSLSSAAVPVCSFLVSGACTALTERNLARTLSPCLRNGLVFGVAPLLGAAGGIFVSFFVSGELWSLAGYVKNSYNL